MDRGTVALLATVATVTLFLTNGRTVLEIYRTKRVANVPFLPFLSTAVNCALWSGYGLLVHDSMLVLVNGLGLSLALLYMSVFYNYTTERAVTRQLVAYALFFLVFVFLYLSIADETTRVLHLGLFCCCGSIVMFGSPLATVGEVVRTGDTSSLSFPLCFMNLVVSGLWTYYGLLLGDMFIALPNGIAMLLASGQLALFALYNRAMLLQMGVDPVKAEHMLQSLVSNPAATDTATDKESMV